MAHHIIQILSRIFCTILFITINITAESDWLQECGKCKCKWSSGKKFGDCKNISINRVPLGLSTELQVVDLSFNTFTEIRKQEFANANLQNLHKLFLKNCSLREINRDGLKNLKILIEIDLSYNLMKYIHPGVFYGLIKLRTVILNNNQLERLDDRLFENLDFLHKLELKENRLHKISLNTFVNVPVLSHIYLDSNNLRTLRRESFHNLEKLTSLSLAENPWNCTCDLKAFRDFTIEKNLYTPPTDCQEPPSLRGKLWSEIPTDYFACKPKILIPLAGALLDAYTENVTLTCRIKGSPTPDVTWYYNKQIINDYERRYHVKKLVEKVTRNTMETVTSELTIIGVKSTDKGTYTCIAKNRGGKDQADILLAISLDDERNAKGFQSINLLVIICLVSASILLVLIIGLLYHIFKRRKSNQNNLDKNIIDDKLERITQDDMDNVILNSKSTTLAKDTQKGSQEVNLIEKPIRRAYVELNGNAVIERPNECSKIRIDESNFAVNLFNDNGTTNSSTILTDPLPTSNQIQTTTTLTTTGPTKSYQKFFINDNSHLPPDLLTLPT